jgi:hypothetical protein
MADQIVIKTYHFGLPRYAVAIEQTIAFLRDGRFRPPLQDGVAAARALAMQGNTQSSFL